MSTLGGRKLRPIAIVCAVVLLLWGVCSAVALAARLVNLSDEGWAPSGTWSWTFEVLVVAAAAVGTLAVLWGILGLLRRPPLHLGAVTVLVSVGLEVASIVVDHVRGHAGYDMIWSAYRHGALDQGNPGIPTWRFVAPSWPLLTAVLPVLLWLVVLVTGAGRRIDAAAVDAASAPWPPRRTEEVAEGPGVAGPVVGSSEAAEPVESAESAESVESVESPAPAEAVENAAPEEVAVPAEQPESSEPSEPDAAAPTAVPDDAAVWFVTVQGRDHGPYSRTRLRGYLAEGRLHDGTITHLADGEVRRLADVVA